MQNVHFLFKKEEENIHKSAYFSGKNRVNQKTKKLVICKKSKGGRVEEKRKRIEF